MALKEIVHQQMLFDQILLGILALAFTAWAGVVWAGLKSIGVKFDQLRTELSSKTDALRQDMMGHMLETERRLTHLESVVSAALEEKKPKIRVKSGDSATIKSN